MPCSYISQYYSPLIEVICSTVSRSSTASMDCSELWILQDWLFSTHFQLKLEEFIAANNFLGKTGTFGRTALSKMIKTLSKRMVYTWWMAVLDHEYVECTIENLKDSKAPDKVHEREKHKEWIQEGIDIMCTSNCNYWWSLLIIPSCWVVLANG